MFAFDSALKPAEVFEAIRKNAENLDAIYLVGGVVRDLLIQRPVHDIDLVMAGDARKLAKRVANTLEGDFFVLDSERKTVRVLYPVPGSEKLVIDFAVFRGDSLEEDLQARDFTINAMALTLKHPGRLIDPLKGAHDLKNKVIRLCRPDALLSDPLRVIRAVRFAVDLGCKILPETWQLMKDTAPKLAEVSAERKRDETFRILGGREISSAFRLLDRAGALGFIVPGLSGYRGSRTPPLPDEAEHFEAAMVRLQKLEELLDVLGKTDGRQSAQNMILGAAVLRLNRSRERLREHLDRQISFGRSARQLLYLAEAIRSTIKGEGLEPDSINKLTVEHARALALSVMEMKRLEKTIAGISLFNSLCDLRVELSPTDIYRYFRDVGEAGIDATLLGLAGVLAAHRSSLPQDLWLKQLAVVEQIWDAWWNHRVEMVNPPQIISGDDLQFQFKIKPGPMIGMVLEAVREAQVEGKVTSREEAFQFLSRWLAVQNF